MVHFFSISIVLAGVWHQDDCYLSQLGVQPRVSVCLSVTYFTVMPLCDPFHSVPACLA